MLHPETKIKLLTQKPVFDKGLFGQAVFFRTYSRIKENGLNESWNDVVIRVVEGTFSIRKDHYIKNHIEWDEDYWQHYAVGFSQYLFDMKWMPPGRGLWAMGTDFVYERGSMALNNCAFIEMKDRLGADCYWIMDALMCGCGVGFAPIRNNSFKLIQPVGTYNHVIPDTREGWCESQQLLVDAWITGTPEPIFDYRLLRKKGEPIKGFGGLASGPAPLEKLHDRTRQFLLAYLEGDMDTVELKTNLANCIGAAVVAGNVRRSAEIACGPITDQTFLDLKNYDKNPHRADYGWMSNNSVYLEEYSDFLLLGEIAKRVIKNGEPGYVNLRNIGLGRIGKNDGLPIDKATGFNPCGEQPLESHELCTLAETCPTKCNGLLEFYQACEYATIYASTVTLLPTHSRITNAVMSRNRRIGVGIIDISTWKTQIGMHKLVRALRIGYNRVRTTNKDANNQAGIPVSIRVTTIKPGGTVPIVVGRNSGWNAPNFYHHIRRMNVADNSQLGELLKKAGVPWEPSLTSEGTNVFEFPVKPWGDAKIAAKTSIWEQAMMLITLQAEWADNAVSNTITFKDHEEPDIELVLSMLAPHTKSVSLLRLVEHGKTVYPQMPEEAITEEEYNRRVSAIDNIDWTRLSEESVPDSYCSGDKCELRPEALNV